MFTSNDKPYRFSKPDTGSYSDPQSDAVGALVAIVILSLCGFMLWVMP